MRRLSIKTIDTLRKNHSKSVVHDLLDLLQEAYAEVDDQKARLRAITMHAVKIIGDDYDPNRPGAAMEFIAFCKQRASEIHQIIKMRKRSIQ